jgi:hypothetical protein
MMEDPEVPTPPLESALPLESVQPPPPPQRDPFWSYSDLLIFLGLAIPCMLLGYGAVKAAFWIFHLHPAVKTWELLAEQFAGYGLLFGMLVMLAPTFPPGPTKTVGQLNRIMVPGLHNLITQMPPVTRQPAPYAAVFELNPSVFQACDGDNLAVGGPEPCFAPVGLHIIARGCRAVADHDLGTLTGSLQLLPCLRVAEIFRKVVQ